MMINSNKTAIVNLNSLNKTNYDFTIKNLSYTSANISIVNGSTPFAFQGSAVFPTLTFLTTNAITLATSPTVVGSVELKSFPYTTFMLAYLPGVNATF